jgi:hypothetical protein
MSATSYARLAAVIFVIIALLQLLRAVAGWPVTVGGSEMPIWPSWVAFVVARRPVQRCHDRDRGLATCPKAGRGAERDRRD